MFLIGKTKKSQKAGRNRKDFFRCSRCCTQFKPDGHKKQSSVYDELRIFF